MEPSEPVVEALREALDYVCRPPLALDFATKGSSIRCARLSSRVLNLMESMDKSGFSHIPVIEKEKFLGVFSVSTIFSCILRDPTLLHHEGNDAFTAWENAGRRKACGKLCVCRRENDLH